MCFTFRREHHNGLLTPQIENRHSNKRSHRDAEQSEIICRLRRGAPPRTCFAIEICDIFAGRRDLQEGRRGFGNVHRPIWKSSRPRQGKRDTGDALGGFGFR